MVGILWKSGVIGKLHHVRFADENVGGSVVDIFWKNARSWQAVLHPVRQRNEGGAVGVFWFQGFEFFFVVSYGGRGAELEGLN